MLNLIEHCVVTEFAFTCRPRKLSVIFGNAKASFTREWRKPGFSFCDLCGLDLWHYTAESKSCLLQLVWLSQLSDFAAIKRLVTVRKILIGQSVESSYTTAISKLSNWRKNLVPVLPMIRKTKANHSF